MEFRDAVNHRRAVRRYRPEPIDTEAVRRCVELATLAPSSSNMQLWEVRHVTTPTVVSALATACLGQLAATTAQQLVVFVTRQDLHREHARQMLSLETVNVRRNSPTQRQHKRIRRWQRYYREVMPLLYSRFFGLLGVARKVAATAIGLARPMVRQVSEADVRVVVHKSCALAAQTFMLAMADEGLDTCPMEGFDSRRASAILELPRGAEINMIISCGVREETGVWGDRMRLPFEQVYREV